MDESIIYNIIKDGEIPKSPESPESTESPNSPNSPKSETKSENDQENDRVIMADVRDFCIIQ